MNIKKLIAFYNLENDLKKSDKLNMLKLAGLLSEKNKRSVHANYINLSYINTGRTKKISTKLLKEISEVLNIPFERIIML